MCVCVYIVHFRMTKRKFRRCPACQTENQAIRKCCSTCYASLSKSKKMEALKDRLDNKWGQGVWKNRNAARVVSSAQVAVSNNISCFMNWIVVNMKLKAHYININTILHYHFKLRRTIRRESTHISVA